MILGRIMICRPLRLILRTRCTAVAITSIEPLTGRVFFDSFAFVFSVIKGIRK